MELMVPFLRDDPALDECDHGATVTAHLAIWEHDGMGDVDDVTARLLQTVRG